MDSNNEKLTLLPQPSLGESRCAIIGAGLTRRSHCYYHLELFDLILERECHKTNRIQEITHITNCYKL